MVNKTNIYGFAVAYDQDAADGVKYLRDDLQREEARVFFDQAKSRGSAQFEDDYDKDYTLIYQNGAYVLTRRSRE